MSDYNSSLPTRTENNGDVAVKVVDGTITSQALTVNANGSVNVEDGGGSLTVDGTVELGATTLAALESITVQNGSGAAAVNVQDGGNSLTVDAVDLDIRNLVFATDKVDATGSQVGVTNLPTTADTNFGTVGASTLRVAAEPGNATGIADFNAGTTGAQTPRVTANITRNGTELAYNVGASDANTQRVASLIHDGTDTLAVNTDGSINVVVQEDVGTEVVNYNTAAALAAGGTSNHDLVFATASKLFQVLASASGKLKITVQIETGSATNTFNTIAVAFNSTANPNISINLSKYAAIPLGARVRVIRQNNDNQAQDVYSTIVGILS